MTAFVSAVPGSCTNRPRCDAVGDPKELSTKVFRGLPTKAELDTPREAGINRVLYEVPDESRDGQLRALDEVVKLIN